MTAAPPFRPPALLRSAHVQTLLASVGPRRLDIARRAADLLARSADQLLDCGDGVRLLAHLTPARQPNGDLVVILHGWEGSATSQYVLSAGADLLRRGYGIARLNLRDHGPTHALNRELFHSCRIDEVVGAVAAIGRLVPHRRLLFLGYSLGGNFGLRVALRAPARGLDLAAVAAVCPVLDPPQTMERLEDKAAFYGHYFVRKWSRSLARKQAAWPEHFDFRQLLRRPTLGGLTRRLVEDYTDYPDIQTYLRGYALDGSRLAGLAVPTLLVAAQDDPIIAPREVEHLRQAAPPALTVDLQRHGGHCGFLQALSGPSWADRRIGDWFGRR